MLPLDRLLVLPLRLEAFVPLLHHDEGDARVGEAGAIVENRDAADGDDMLDAGDFRRESLDLRQHRVGAFLRRPVRQLHDDDHVALILGRQESGRHPGQRPDGEDDEGDSARPTMRRARLVMPPIRRT